MTTLPIIAALCLLVLGMAFTFLAREAHASWRLAIAVGVIATAVFGGIVFCVIDLLLKGF